MNYGTKFYNKPKLPNQRMVSHGDLKCPFTGALFSQSIVDEYNRYTAAYNQANDRPMQEFLLDQRAFFLNACAFKNVANDEYEDRLATAV
ncbi:MAG: hypothetical protein VX061_17060 [Pseudomonadota bacterium]|nr:hypothetical protein [Pseudomonadota bacterium]|tara:strand:+ start:5725 stop:5994 length:270 start_codon:yes stop_codon:yes gene_type:complete